MAIFEELLLALLLNLAINLLAGRVGNLYLLASISLRKLIVFVKLSMF